MRFPRIAVPLVLAAFLAAPPALAEDGMTEGTVKNIDAAAGKVTIKHGPIDNLKMPPMTMVFGVTDPAMLESLAAGDDVVFVATEEDGRFFVTEVQSKN